MSEHNGYLRIRKRASWMFRLATSGVRALPDYIIIGAQKSGTSSLHHYLSQHPDVRAPITKEVHFFDGGVDHRFDNFRLGPWWYRSHFPVRVGGSFQTGESSPLYIFDPRVPGRIRTTTPRARLIAILRDPVERAISHYFHEVRKGRERRSFAQAISEETEALAAVRASRDYSNPVFRHQSYVTRGLYSEQLSRYLEIFERSQVHVVCSESFFENTESELRRIFRFLHLDSTVQVTDLRAVNVASNRDEVPDHLVRELKEFFAPHNRALSSLLGEDFPW